jgi:glycosyltransferase involved in cell wall biosynthesis
MGVSLSLIIPAYNEAIRLGKTIRTVFEYLNQNIPDSELIIVDDGSTDSTPTIAEESFKDAGYVCARLIRIESNRGKGCAVRAGLLAAQAPIALFSDADLSAPITETPKLIESINRGEYDLTFGSRALDRSLIWVHQPWRREQGGRVMNLIIRRATGMPFWDTQCGFKAFRMSVCRPLIEAATIDRFGFDIELLYLAHLASLRMLEIAVRWDHNDGSKLAVVRDTRRMLREIQLIRQRVRRGIYTAAINEARAIATHERGSPSKDIPAAQSEITTEQKSITGSV